jgi:ABC-type transporter Mla subunit MlaD
MQLAQTLDELDRQLAASQAGQPEGQQSLQQTQQAQARQNRLAATRRQAQQRALQALAQASAQPADGFSEPPDAQPFDVTQVNRVENAKWGKLRGQAAEDVARGRGEQISEAYRKSVETYFRVLSERARKPQ